MLDRDNASSLVLTWFPFPFSKPFFFSLIKVPKFHPYGLLLNVCRACLACSFPTCDAELRLALAWTRVTKRSTQTLL